MVDTVHRDRARPTGRASVRQAGRSVEQHCRLMGTVCRSMVNSDKRQRHKDGHRSRVEAAADRRRAAPQAPPAHHRSRSSSSLIVRRCSSLVTRHLRATTTRTPAATTTAPNETTTVPRPPSPHRAPGEADRRRDAVPAGRRQRGAHHRLRPGAADLHRRGEDLHGDGEDLRGRHHDRPRHRATRRSRVNNFVVLSRYHFFDGLALPPRRARLRRPDRRLGRPDTGSGGPGYDLPARAPDPPTTWRATWRWPRAAAPTPRQPVLLHDRPDQPAGRLVPDLRHGQQGPWTSCETINDLGDRPDGPPTQVGHHRLGRRSPSR